MSRFLLQPCKIRENRVVPVAAAALDLDTKALLEKFAPTRDPRELVKLRSMRIEGYLGRSRGGKTGTEQLFFLWNQDRSNHLDFVLHGDPDFPSRVVEIYHVRVVDWGSRFDEPESGKKDLLPGNDVPKRAGLRESM